jgi:hypothetical protein
MPWEEFSKLFTSVDICDRTTTRDLKLQVHEDRTPSHPHTLTPSHPHTLTPSHPHTLTPSPPIPHPPPSHPHTLTSMPSPSTFHTLGERGPRLVRRALGLPLRMLLLHLRMQGAARHLRRAPRIRPDQIGEARLLRHGVRGGYHRVGIPLYTWLSVTTRCGGSGAGEGWRGLCGGECVASCEVQSGS